MNVPNGQPVLDEAHADFIRGPVSIIAACCDGARIPALMRVLGCRVSADRREVTILLAESQSVELLANLRRGAPIAVVFCLPSTHQTIQLKAPRAEVSKAGPNDVALKARYAEDFVAELQRVGDATAFAHAYVWCEPADLVAVSFAPTAAFQQTPGPGAGAALSQAR